MTFALGPRLLLLAQPADVRDANIAAIPDPTARAARRSVIEHGVHAPEFKGALAQMIAFLDRMEASLATSGWLSGESFGLADAAAAPYVLRLDHLAMTPLLGGGVRPAVAGWFGRLQSRPSFDTAVIKWVPEPAVDLMRANGHAAWPAIEALHGAA